MYELYYTKSGAAWSSRKLIWRSDMAIDPDKYGIYDMKCSVEVNKAGELKFLMTKTCSSYDLFSKERSVLTLLLDDSTTIFRGVVKLIETDLFFQRTITANSDLVYLSDSVFEPHGKDIEETPKERFKRIIDHHNVEMQGDPEKQIRVGKFDISDSQGADKKEKYTKNGGYKDTMSQLQNDFKDFYGFYQIRYSDDYSQKWLDYMETTGKSTSQDIKFAANIEDYQFKDTVDDLFTILIPIGGDNLTLSDQNAKKKVKIRMPDQSKREIDLYVVDKYIKIVEGIKKYGYIYQAESFTVDANNIGVTGTNGAIKNSWSDKNRTNSNTSYIYKGMIPTIGGSSPSNPKALGWYYLDENGNYVKSKDTTAKLGTFYYTRIAVTTTTNKSDEGSEGESAGHTFVKATLYPNQNPSELGLYEKRAFTISTYIKTSDTSPLYGKTYYEKV